MGSTYAKGVLMESDRVIDTVTVSSGIYPKQTAIEIYRKFAGDKKIRTVATGYGRAVVDFADKKITEITCHAKGAHFLNPEIRSVIDIGGQDCKAIALDRDGTVLDFIMNDKCAAGTGKFVEMMMKTLGKELRELDFVIRDANPVKITSMCAVFAESEIISLLSKGEEPKNIAAGVVSSVISRMSLLSSRLSLEGPVFFSGGLAQCPVIRVQMEDALKKTVYSHEYSQLVGAIGAAVMAQK